MEMTGEYRIPASRVTVWEALNNPEILRVSIPGCQSLDKTSDNEMNAKVVAKIGPVKATFDGHVTLSNINPPAGYTITGEGKGGVAGFAKGGADVSLEEDGPSATILRYKAQAQVGGKLAQIGARLVDATAKQMADQFFGNFAEKVGGAPAGPAAAVEDKGERAVAADVLRDPVVTAEAIEEEAEEAAVSNWLGGPYMWGLIALIVVIVVILIFR